jgi:hypothetical protein
MEEARRLLGGLMCRKFPRRVFNHRCKLRSEADAYAERIKEVLEQNDCDFEKEVAIRISEFHQGLGVGKHPVTEAYKYDRINSQSSPCAPLVSF